MNDTLCTKCKRIQGIHNMPFNKYLCYNCYQEWSKVFDESGINNLAPRKFNRAWNTLFFEWLDGKEKVIFT